MIKIVRGCVEKEDIDVINNYLILCEIIFQSPHNNLIKKIKQMQKIIIITKGKR